MTVAVVHVRHVRMRVTDRLVTMAMAVRTGRFLVVRVGVMAVVVRMRMFMFQRVVQVFVTVRLEQVEHHAGEHQQRPGRHAPRDRAIA